MPGTSSAIGSAVAPTRSSGGSFRTMKEAKARRDLIGGEIAAGRNPADLLRAMVSAAAPKLTVRPGRRSSSPRGSTSTPNTIRNYKTALKKVGETFGDRDPATITVDEVAGGCPSSQRPEAGNDPAVPAHVPDADRLRRRRPEPGPGPAGEAAEAASARSRPRRPPSTCSRSSRRSTTRSAASCSSPWSRARYGSARPSHLRWGDVDRAGLRLRLPRSATKRDQARWVYLPEWW